jgi:hypothetical protein
MVSGNNNYISRRSILDVKEDDVEVFIIASADHACLR